MKERTHVIKFSSTISAEAMKILYRRKDGDGIPLAQSIDKAIKLAERMKWREK